MTSRICFVLVLAAAVAAASGAASDQAPAPQPGTPAPQPSGDAGAARRGASFPGHQSRPWRTLSGDALAKARQFLSRRVSIDLKDAPLSAALELLSRLSGASIRAEEGFQPDVRLTLKLDDLPLLSVLEMIGKQAGAIIRPDATGSGAVFAKHPQPVSPFGYENSPWAPEWFGPAPTAPPVRLSPQSVTALDPTHFVVLSTSTSVGNQVQVGEGENAVNVVLPLAVLTLYRIVDGKIVQEASTVHRIEDADVRKVMHGMQRTGWSGWSREGGKSN